MTDHWKNVLSGPMAAMWLHRDVVDAARAKDAEAHAAALAEKDAEITDLRRRLGWFTSYPCHWTRTDSEYTTDCGQIVFPVSATPDGLCGGCGRPIVVS